MIGLISAEETPSPRFEERVRAAYVRTIKIWMGFSGFPNPLSASSTPLAQRRRHGLMVRVGGKPTKDQIHLSPSRATRGNLARIWDLSNKGVREVLKGKCKNAL